MVMYKKMQSKTKPLIVFPSILYYNYIASYCEEINKMYVCITQAATELLID